MCVSRETQHISYTECVVHGSGLGTKLDYITYSVPPFDSSPIVVYKFVQPTAKQGKQQEEVKETQERNK